LININEQLAYAITLAAETHLEQFDKGGSPYILHPLHLMNQLLFDKELAIIAVLHDIVEDSDGKITIKVLGLMGYSSRITDAILLLTHDNRDTYDQYINRICNSKNLDAILVKRKDLEHNSDITRMKNKFELEDEDVKRLIKYHKAFVRLTIAKCYVMNKV